VGRGGADFVDIELGDLVRVAMDDGSALADDASILEARIIRWPGSAR
jgi:hypothetical protein